MSPTRTRRQRLADLLLAGSPPPGEVAAEAPRSFTFEGLRAELEVPVHVLEEDLTHLVKSLRARGHRLLIEPARCAECGFVFRDRVPRHFHDPGRCPHCHGEAIRPASYRIAGG